MKIYALVLVFMLGCGGETVVDSSQDRGDDVCVGAEEYAECEDPAIPGGGACVKGECVCYADAQCQDADPCTNNYCANGACVADRACKEAP